MPRVLCPKKKKKIHDAIISSTIDKTIKELEQEVNEMRSEAKLIGNQIKEKRNSVADKVVQPSPKKPKPVNSPLVTKKTLKIEF